jgi:hypothetical protein
MIGALYALRPLLVIGMWIAGFLILVLNGQPWWGVPCLAGAVLGIGRNP